MIVNLYALRDTVTNNFSDIKLYVNDEHAKREYCSQLLKCSDSPMIKDLQIFKLGSYDLVNGDIISDKVFVCNAKEVMNYGEE